MAIQAPLSSQLRFELSGRGAGTTAGVSCYHANSLLVLTKNTRKPAERHESEVPKKKKSVFHSTLALYYATILCLIVSWHGNEQPS